MKMKFSDWSKLTDDTFYNVTFTINFESINSGESVTFTDTFMLCLGQVQIQTVSSGNFLVSYDENLVIDLSDSYDPEQPESGVLVFSWECPAELDASLCSNFNKIATLSPLARITEFNMIFDTLYTFKATIKNEKRNIKKEITKEYVVIVKNPEQDSDNLGCASILLQFANDLQPVPTQYYTTISFDNNNVTAVQMEEPLVDLS
mmetsp:Transcript_9602/g.9260  ORF Transcript_9602/g.9260 Transcript_9602/m.9260 type:complete len:204 (+) Transcript_9602:388-999(+)